MLILVIVLTHASVGTCDRVDITDITLTDMFLPVLTHIIVLTFNTDITLSDMSLPVLTHVITSCTLTAMLLPVKSYIIVDITDSTLINMSSPVHVILLALRTIL